MVNKSENKDPYHLDQIAEIKVSYDPFYNPSERWQVNSSQDAYDLFCSVWDKSGIAFQEEFLVIYLNRANQALGVYRHAKGSDVSCVVSVKQILAIGLKSNACSFIVAHNHPSSNLRPSREDADLTTQIREAGLVVQLKLLDHLILRKEEGYYSFADEGEI